MSLDRLGPYVLDELIGHGASCRVWRAKPADGSAPVAIKILRSERADEPDSRARFLAEGQLLVDHPIPGAVKVLDIVDDPERPAIVMELLDGPTLRKLLSDEGQLAPERAVDLLSQLGATLAAAHKAGIAHGDVKPENVIVTRDEQGLESPIITDFGLARVLEQAGTTHSRSQVIGTPHYAGPEVHSGEKPQAATDVYALGVLGYEMVTGSRPFVAPTTSGLISQHLHDAPPADPRIPPNLWVILAACLAKNPAARPPSSRLALGLSDLLSGDQLSADATPTTRWLPAPTVPTEEPKPNRRPVYAALAVVALVVAGGGGYVAVARSGVADIALVPPAEAPTTDVVEPAGSTSDATSSAPPTGATEDGKTSAGPSSEPVGARTPEASPSAPRSQAPRVPQPPPEQPAPPKPPAAPPASSWSGSVWDASGKYRMTVKMEYHLVGGERRWTTLKYRVDGPARSPVSVDWRVWKGPTTSRETVAERLERGTIVVGRQYDVSLGFITPVADREQFAVSFTLDPESPARKKWFSVDFVT